LNEQAFLIGHSGHRGRSLHTFAAKSMMPHVASLGSPQVTAKLRRKAFNSPGNLRASPSSTSSALPKTLLTLLSTGTMGSPREKQRIAEAIYCPTPGNFRRISSSVGISPLSSRCTVVATCLRRAALRLQRPSGFKSISSSPRGALANASMEGYLSKKRGNTLSTISALVFQSRNSESKTS
jgi:hypothetical protein